MAKGGGGAYGNIQAMGTNNHRIAVVVREVKGLVTTGTEAASSCVKGVVVCQGR